MWDLLLKNDSIVIFYGSFKALINYQNYGEAARNAIPTPDHYYPLMYILGLIEKNEKISLFNDKVLMGSLTMTSVKVG